MSRLIIDRRVLRDPSWWHWAISVPLLGLHLRGVTGTIEVAIGLCLVMSGVYFIRLRRVRPFPVQVRLAYIGLLLIGLLPWMGWIHGVQLLGTTAMVTVGYCPLARLLQLAPFNRNEPLTWALLGRVLFREACAGGLVLWSGQSSASVGSCCSVRSPDSGATCSLPHIKPAN